MIHGRQEPELDVLLEGSREGLEVFGRNLAQVVAALRRPEGLVALGKDSGALREVTLRHRDERFRLDRLLRRADAEGWASGPSLRLLRGIAQLFVELDQHLARLQQCDLEMLLRVVVSSPREVALGDRPQVAEGLLEALAAPLASLHALGRVLEQVFGTAPARSSPLAFDSDAWARIVSLWGPGSEALTSCWAYLAGVDTTRGLESSLRRRAQIAPRHGQPRTAIERLLHATYWRELSLARLRALCLDRFAPVAPMTEEWLPAVTYLLDREQDGAARLGSSPREALLMLAHELTGIPLSRPPLVGGAATLAGWAVLADRLQDSDDWRRIRDGLRLLSARSGSAALPPLYRVGMPRRRAPLLDQLSDFFPAR